MKKMLCVALLFSLCLCGCGEKKDDSIESKTTAEVQASVENDNDEFDRVSVVKAYNSNHGTESGDAWDIEDESVKQQVYDWYKEFQNCKEEPVSEELVEQHRIAGKNPVTIYFYDENNEPVTVQQSDSAVADVVVNGQYYRDTNDESVFSVVLQ